MLTCPNPSCGRVFATPIKTLNLKDPGRPYPACPYCFTRISDPHIESRKSQSQDEKCSAKERTSKDKDKPQNCRNHFGYLSERENKQQIPDECIVCTVIIDCMLQKMKAEA